MRSSFAAQSSRSGSRQNAYSPSENLSSQEPSIYHGKMRTAPEGSTPVDIILGVSAETVHAITAHQQKMMFQSPIGVMKEVVWDHTEKSVHFVLDDGSTSPTFVFPVLTELEAHFTSILALPDLEKPPEQVYIGVLIGQNLPSPIQQRRASLGSSQPAMLPMTKRRELLKREQPVKNAMSRERLGVEYIRSGYLGFTCSISGDLRGLTLGVHHIRVYPSPDCHDRSACLFSYSYEHLESCEVAGTRLELRFRTNHQLAKQPSYLVFQSLEAQYIREAIWYLKNGTYMDFSLREILASPTRTPRSSNADFTVQVPDIATSRRTSVLLFFADADSLKQRIDACCRVIGCRNLAENNDQNDSKTNDESASNVMINSQSQQLSHMNPSLPSMLRVMTNGLCDLHASCLSSAPNEVLLRQKSGLSREKVPLPPKTIQPLITLLQSTHYANMFKFQGQLQKRQNARTFHLRKAWHPKFVVLFETPVGGFLCYYDKITHCPGMTDTPKERRVIDLSSVICIRPVSAASPVGRGNNTNTPTMHAFDVVTLYRTWTFAASEPDEYEMWLNVLSECVEKHSTIASDRILRFPVKLAMAGQTSPTEATSLEISSHGVSFCTGHDAEVELSSWYYTDLEKWSVVFQQGYTCCLLKCRNPAPASPGSPRTAGTETVTQEFLFRTTEASTICLAIEFYVGKCMAKLEVLAGQYLEESRARRSKTTLIADPIAAKRGTSHPKLDLKLVKEHPIENVSLAPIGSPEKLTLVQTEMQSDLKVVSEHHRSADARIVDQADETSINLGPEEFRGGEFDVQSFVQDVKANGETSKDLGVHSSSFEHVSTTTVPCVAPGLKDETLVVLEDDIVELIDPSTDELQPSVAWCVISDTMDEKLDADWEVAPANNIDSSLNMTVSETVTDEDPPVVVNTLQVFREAEEHITEEDRDLVGDTQQQLLDPVLESLDTNDNGSEFESIDLDDAKEVVSIQLESQVDAVGLADQQNGRVDDIHAPSDVPVDDNALQPSLLDPPHSEMQERCDVHQDDDIEQPLTVDSDVADTSTSPSSTSSDVFMVEFRADVACIRDNEPAKVQPQPVHSRAAAPAPILLLGYLPSWPGEAQAHQLDVLADQVNDPRASPPHEDAAERDDTRESERDTFNSCASDEFEDAVDDASRASSTGHVGGTHLGETVDVLDLLRLATLETVEAIVAWRSYKLKRKASEKRTPLAAEVEQFKWSGINYLLKLASDLEFLGKHTGLTDWLGFTLERNPFILPLNLDCRAKLAADQRNAQPADRIDTADSNRFVQVGGKRSCNVRESLRNVNGDSEKPSGPNEALAMALAERRRAKTPYETRVVNDEELVPNTPTKVGALRPKSRALPRSGKTKYSSVLPSQIGEVDMARLHEAELVVLQEESAFGRYARDIHGRVVPEEEAQRRSSMVQLSGNAYNIPSTLSSSYTAEDPEGNILRLGDPSQSDVMGKFYAKKRSGMLGPISKPDWRSFDRPPPPRRRARGAQLEEALAVERKANAQLGVLLDSLREDMERKGMDVAFFESCAELQVYSEELRTFTIQAQRELAVLRREFEEKKYMYERKIVNIQKKEELLNTFKSQFKAVKDATRIVSSREETTKVASLNQEQQRREDQEQAAIHAAAAAEKHDHDQAAPVVQHFCATQIQKFARGMLAREIYARMKIEFVVASTFIQAGVRGYLARRRVAKMYWQNTASVHLQRAARGWLARRLTQARRRRRLQENAAQRIQKVTRGRFGRVRMSKIRKLVSWRLQLGMAARSINVVALKELAAACQEMVALPNLMKTKSKITSDGVSLPALVLGLVRMLMIFTSDADDEWDIPNTRWREAAHFLRCGVGVSRRMQKIADAASGAARAWMNSSGGFVAAGVAASTPYLRESSLGIALLDAYTADRDFRVEAFEQIARGWQAAVAIFKWTTAFAAITQLQHLLEPSAASSDPYLIVQATLNKREAQHEVTERRDANHVDEVLARRFVPAELAQAPGYPFHRPRPLLLVVANDVPQQARTIILEKLQVALPGLFLTITRPPAPKRRSLGVEDSGQAFDFNAIRDAVSLGYSVILEGDVGLRDVTQRAFLSCFATIKSGLHPPPMCVLLRGTITNRSDLFGPKEGSDKMEEAYQEEIKRRMVDADVKLALDRTTRLRLELAEEAVAQEMVEQSRCGIDSLAPAPNPALVVVMEATIILLTPGKVYEGPAQSDIATSSVSWRLSRRLLAQPAFLRAKLQQVDITKIPPMNLVALERYLRHALWPSAVVARSLVATSRVVFALAGWIESAVSTAQLIAADGTGFLAPEITRYEPVPGLFERVVVFDNCPVDYVQDGAGEDSAVMQLMDAVLADVRVYRTAHLLVSSSVNVTNQAHKKIKTADQEERCVVTLFHECRRIFASVYSPSSGQRWFTVISEEDIDKLLTPTAMSLGGETKANKLPPKSHTEMYGRLARLCLLQRRRLEDLPESIDPPSTYELVVRPHAVRLYRRVLLLGGYLTTITIAELARGHVQVDAFVHGSNSHNTLAQSVALTLAVELENVLGRLSAAQARRVFIPSCNIPSLMLDRLRLFRTTRTLMVLPEFQPIVSALKLSIRTTECAPGRVILRRAMRMPSSYHGAALGERWVFTLFERHEERGFQASFYSPGSSTCHAIRLTDNSAQVLLHLSRHTTPSQLQLVLLRSFCFAQSAAMEPKDVQYSDGDDEDNKVQGATDVLSCYRLRRQVIARFPCTLRVMENPHQRVTKKQVIRAYVQVELCDPETKLGDPGVNHTPSGDPSTDALRYRVWLPESCVQQTLLLQESEIEASLPVELSWKHSLPHERKGISHDLVRHYFEWDPNGGRGDNGCVVARLPCGSFWATEVAHPICAGSYIGKAQAVPHEEPTKLKRHQSRPVMHRTIEDGIISVVSCTSLLNDRETESDDEEDENLEYIANGVRCQRKIYSYDTEELVHRGSYRANGLYVVVRVTMRAEVLRDLRPTLVSPTDRVRERNSFKFKFHVYHPASSGSAIAEIHGYKDLREVVGPDQASLIASTSIDSLLRHIILARLDVQVDCGSKGKQRGLKVTFLHDRLYAKQKATPVTKTFDRDSKVNAAKLIDESRRRGAAGERGIKILTTSKFVAGCGRTLLTVFDIAARHRLDQGERSPTHNVMLRVDAYICATSARLSLVLEGSDLVHIAGDEDKELLIPIFYKDASSQEIEEMEKTRSRRLAEIVLEYLRVEQRSDGRGDRLVLSDYSCSLIDMATTESKSKRLFKTVRAVGSDQVLLSAYLDEDSSSIHSSLWLRLELYDPVSSSKCSLKLSRSTVCAILGLPEAVELVEFLHGASGLNSMTHIFSFLHIEKASAISDGAVDRPASFAMTVVFDEQQASECIKQHINPGNANGGVTICAWSGLTTGKGGNYFSVHLQLVNEQHINNQPKQEAQLSLVCSAFAPSEMLVGIRQFKWSDLPADALANDPWLTVADNQEFSPDYTAFFGRVCKQLRIEIQHGTDELDKAYVEGNEENGLEQKCIAISF
ncbi:unnamed protein product [Phytophthora fragariaefolia]|uniref:Unnamed protein product n=1 Tax=Phytophthora fragariaefolia TaxID=1490495 RepID=A0A9W6XMD7_9STRA|nr:unnamed protein product [Phytophthora fragariaefolia]